MPRAPPCRKAEVKLLPADVDLPVPLPRLFQERDAAVPTRLRPVPPSLRAERRHELDDRNALERLHLAPRNQPPGIRLRRSPGFVDCRAIKRASRLLLRVVVTEMESREGIGSRSKVKAPSAMRRKARRARRNDRGASGRVATASKFSGSLVRAPGTIFHRGNGYEFWKSDARSASSRASRKRRARRDERVAP